MYHLDLATIRVVLVTFLEKSSRNLAFFITIRYSFGRNFSNNYTQSEYFTKLPSHSHRIFKILANK